MAAPPHPVPLPHCAVMSACDASASPSTRPSLVTTATPVSSQEDSIPSTRTGVEGEEEDEEEEGEEEGEEEAGLVPRVGAEVEEEVEEEDTQRVGGRLRGVELEL